MRKQGVKRLGNLGLLNVHVVNLTVKEVLKGVKEVNGDVRVI